MYTLISAEELDEHTPHTKGWQSSRNCSYPQEIGLELDASNGAKISQIQILSHQMKISSKIELFIGSGRDYNSSTFQRLGYLSLDTNERCMHETLQLP